MVKRLVGPWVGRLVDEGHKVHPSVPEIILRKAVSR